MKKFIKTLVIFALILLLGFVWLNNPHLFPSPPESITLFLVDVVGAQSQEDISDIELIYVLCGSAIIATFVVFLCSYVYKKILVGYCKRS